MTVETQSSHPLASDPNWQPEAQAYLYYDKHLKEIWHSSQPLTDEEAKVHLQKILGIEPSAIRARRHDGTVEVVLWNL